MFIRQLLIKKQIEKRNLFKNNNISTGLKSAKPPVQSAKAVLNDAVTDLNAIGLITCFPFLQLL